MSEKEINCVGWYAVFNFDTPVATFKLKEDAEMFLSLAPDNIKYQFSVKEITRKVDFSEDEIKLELAKRCAQREMASCHAKVTIQ